MEGKGKRGVPVPVAGWPRQAEMWGDAVVSVGLAGVRGLWVHRDTSRWQLEAGQDWGGERQ